MGRSFGLVVAGQELAEAAVAEDVAEAGARLAKKLLAMGEEEKGRPARLACVVEAGQHGLAGAGGGDDQVAVAAAAVSLLGELVEDLLLEGVGAQVE